jgi:hypothetical protein
MGRTNVQVPCQSGIFNLKICGGYFPPLGECANITKDLFDFNGKAGIFSIKSMKLLLRIDFRQRRQKPTTIS